MFSLQLLEIHEKMAKIYRKQVAEFGGYDIHRRGTKEWNCTRTINLIMEQNPFHCLGDNSCSRGDSGLEMVAQSFGMGRLVAIMG